MNWDGFTFPEGTQASLDRLKSVFKMQVMELSQFSDYALRVLIYSGLNQGQLSSVAKIAEVFEISQHHLVKVVHQLAKHGYLKTYRGRGGGFELALPAHEIVVGEVLRKTEHFGLAECLPPRQGTCCLAPACQLKAALIKAREAFLDVLDGYTVKDLLRPNQKLRQSLALVT